MIKLKTKYYLKYINISFVCFFIFLNIANAKELSKCIPPKKLKELDQALDNKVNSISKSNESNKELISDVFWGYKYDLIKRIVDKKFPTAYKDIFDNYIKNFKTLYQISTLSDDDVEFRNYHYYVLANIIPIILDDRLFFDVTIPAERELEKKASENNVWQELSRELDFRNLEICRDEENSKKDLGTNLEEGKEYKTILENSFLKTINFDPNYRIPIPVAKNFLSDPKASKIKDKENWWKSFINFVTGNEEERAEEFKKDSIENQLTSSSISPKTKLFLAFEKEHKIKSRYLDWRNNRNFWIKKTNEVSGYNLDVFVEKYEIMLDSILRINHELKESLEAIAIICESQRTNIPCWSTGNIIPPHSNTDNRKSYGYRTAEFDN